MKHFDLNQWFTGFMLLLGCCFMSFVDEDLFALHLRQHFHDSLVVSILRDLAKAGGIRYSSVSKRFREGDESITAEFWRRIGAEFKGRFCGVYYCDDCQKFGLIECGDSAD